MNLASPHENVRNLRFLTSGRTMNELFDLAFELALILLNYKIALEGDPITRYEDIWRLVQMRKASVLQQQTQGQAKPPHILLAIKEDSQAWQLYHREQELI